MQHELSFKSDLEVDRNRIPCPYLPGREASLVYWLPRSQADGQDLDRRLAAGQRRHGALVYEPRCPDCDACISLRVLVDQFQPTASQRRVWQRGQANLTVQIGRPVVDQARLNLLNQHSEWRGWRGEPDEVSAEFYEQIFVCSLFYSREITYYVGSRLVAVAICDQGTEGVSAVYTFYDPAFAKWSLGTYSVLYQLQYCRTHGVPYLYLGYYVADCPSLRYKANFRPHQRKIKGRWVDFSLGKSF